MTCMGFHFVELFLHIIKSHNFNHTMFTSLPYSNQVLQVLELWLNAVCVCCCKLEYALLTKFIQIKAQSRLIHKNVLAAHEISVFWGHFVTITRIYLLQIPILSGSDYFLRLLIVPWLTTLVCCNSAVLFAWSLNIISFLSFKYVRFKRMCIVLLV